jgi:hypothetical protein
MSFLKRVSRKKNMTKTASRLNIMLVYAKQNYFNIDKRRFFYKINVGGWILRHSNEIIFASGPSSSQRNTVDSKSRHHTNQKKATK